MGTRESVFQLSATHAAPCTECSAQAQCPGSSAAAGSVQTTRVPRETVLLRADQPCETRLYIVRAGGFKRVSPHPSGAWQVTAFHLPGELVGLCLPDQLHHGSYTVALEDSTVCAIEGPRASPPRLLPALNQALEREATTNQLLRQSGCSRRLASFLLDIGQRQAARGYSDRMLRMVMNWRDIASYLQMTPESVSRSLLRFKQDGTLAMQGKHVQLHKQSVLRELARGAAHTGRHAPAEQS